MEWAMRTWIMAVTTVCLVALLAACDADETSDEEDILDADVTLDADTGTDMRDTAPAPNCGGATCDTTETCCGRTCVDPTIDPAHCGACGEACDAAASCESGECVCGGTSCLDDEACCEVDGAPACVATEENPAHCGACGNACGDNESCQGGICLCENADGVLEQCRSDETCCPGLGCKALDSDATSCGTCGLVCGAGELCSDGVCTCGDVSGASGPACSDGEACCGETPACIAEDDPLCTCGTGSCVAGELCCETEVDGTPTDRCIDVGVSTEHCGACGVTCGPSEVCLGGECVCDGGFGDCDGDPANGCEASLSNDVANCGECGVACESGMVCDGIGRCATTCQPGATLCGDTCVWLDRTPVECGSCGLNCASGEVCSGGTCATSCQLGLTNCRGSCVNLDADRFNCGGCGRVCPPGEVCRSGRCAVSCPRGMTNCGGTCVDLDTDELNCAGCGIRCPSGFECSGGQCVLTCQQELVPCNGTCVDTNTNRLHCGACGNTCPSGELCDGGGTCALSCQTGLTECFGVCVALDENPDHCGACGNACAPGEDCVGGSCELVCPGDLESCAGTCIDLQNDRRHCGACGAACADGEICEAGTCELRCPTGQVACGDVCVSTSSNPQHCGACDNACAADEMCASGQCSGTCPFTVCTTTDGDVCVDTTSNPDHCGACGNACTFANGTGACVSGTCVLAGCDTGWDNCDGDTSNGCELDVSADPANCGACRQVCANLDQTTGETCAASTCMIDGCQSGYDDCDGVPWNGCEANLDTDPLNCTACGMVCEADNAVFGCDAACYFVSCDPGYGDCNTDIATDGCETDLNTDTANCGSCGTTCGASATCDAGQCLCDMEACPDTGAHHTSATCSGSDCTIVCEAGFEDCDGDAANSCEAELNADDLNCGTCGNDCTTNGQVCVNGTCQTLYRNCFDLMASGVTTSGTYPLDLDGTQTPVDVYCDMETDGGGWTLISVARNDDNSQVIFADGYCASIDTITNCKGHMPPGQASAFTEILIRDLDNNIWLVHDGWDGGAGSALRYFTRELNLTGDTTCTGFDHVCNDTTRDPSLRFARTSGFTVVATPPLHQWWRGGGWWVGYDSSLGGKLHTTSYMTDGNVIEDNPSAGVTNILGSGHQAIFWR